MNNQQDTHLSKIQLAVDYLMPRIGKKPSIGIISGTGLECLYGITEEPKFFRVTEIPHFPSIGQNERSIIYGGAGKHFILLLTKRLHIYEGYSMADIAFVVRLFRKLGVKILIITNAAGGLNPLYSPGQIMLITDHINLMGGSPLIGPNPDEYGHRFPDMTAPYDPSLIQLMEQTSTKLGIKLLKGVYVGVLGPNLETRAETRFLRMIGADAVGMSTIPEVITAVHCAIKVLGISVLSNINLPDNPKVHTIEEIVEVVKKASPVLLKILGGFLSSIESNIETE